MTRQRFVWTCLPNGLSTEDGQLRLSVLLSPRLDPEAEAPVLASFPEWLDWPAALATADVTILANGQPVASRSVGGKGHDTTLGAPDSAVWTALFGPALPVTPYRLKAEILDSQLNSYSSTDVHDLVRDLYVDLAQRSARVLPRIGADLLEDPLWSGLVEAVAEVDRWGTPEGARNLPRAGGASQAERRFATLRRLADLAPVGSGRRGPAAAAAHLARFELFHTPPLRPKEVQRVARVDDPRISVDTEGFERPPAPASEAELAASFDFHRAVAALNAYPTLLRRLGLVLDFQLDPGLFQAGDVDLSVVVRFPDLPTRQDVADLAPVTKARIGDRSFSARSRVAPGPGIEMRVEAGLLDLYSQPDSFDVLQADVDGAVFKLMNFARSLRQADSIAASDPAHLFDDVTRKDKRAGAPALRTAGLMLVRKDRAGALEARLSQTKAQLAGAAAAVPAVALWAEDLVRGYRIDVWDSRTGVWRSLCRRLATYTLGQGAGAVVVSPAAGEEEATVQLAATRSPDPTYNADILNLHEAMVAWTGWSLAAPPPGRGVGDDINKGPDGKPRFSDGAGAVAGLDFASRFGAVPGSLPRLRYGRSYALRARAVDLAGNSLPPAEADFGPEAPAAAPRPFLRFEPVAAPVIALVRSAGGASPVLAEGEAMARMVIRSFNEVFDDPAASPEVAIRAVLPPQVTVRDAELHGALDQAGQLNPASFALLALDKDRPASDPLAALVEEAVPVGAQPLAEAARYGVWPEGRALTWLPDPMAKRVAARFLGHPAMAEAETIAIDLYPEGAVWPEAQPFTIALSEATTPDEKPAFDAATRVLRVPLAKGERATLRLSMQIRKRDLFERMGLWEWLDQPTRDALAEPTLDGRTWLFTPWQDVELVHAVQRPLIRPRIEDLELRRDTGNTAVFPLFPARVSLKSTDRIDLLARWHEPLEPLGSAGPGDQPRADLAFHIKVTDSGDYQSGPGAHADHTLPADEGRGPDVIGVNSPRRDRLAIRPHEFNDTRYRRIAYRLLATTRYREHLPADLMEAITLEGPETVGWVPSSAPPPAPQILYVVPTFGWVRSRDADGNQRSWRQGGGLRVWLERPWNGSGYGEMLAVVLPPAGLAGDPDSASGGVYRRTVTQWGNDPIWQSPFVPGVAPGPGAFPLARWQADPTGAWLPPEAPASEADQPPGPFFVTPRLPGSNAPVVVAPHDVTYDPERGLWFCDIEVNSGAAYWPFVRLALARYQPCSTEGAHLSEVVLADVMQLAADRSLVVRAPGEGRSRRVTLFGSGYEASGGSREVRPRSEIDVLSGQVNQVTPVSPTPVVKVWLERLEPTLGSDFGWVRIGDGVAADGVPAIGPFAPAPERLALGRELIAERRFAEALALGVGAEQLWLRPPLWDGRIDLPEPDGAELRLVIAEYEEYAIDGPAPRHSMTSTKTGRRLVFVEHVRMT
jgi:hypothetical protein